MKVDPKFGNGIAERLGLATSRARLWTTSKNLIEVIWNPIGGIKLLKDIF